MKTSSSTRLRLGTAVVATTLGLFSLGGSAFAGEGGQGAEHRNERAGAAKTSTTADETDDRTSPDEAKAAQFQADDAEYANSGDTRHPSGNDRLEESGGSGTQGNSTSDPDGDLNGGADKPGGEGGLFDGDRDGNNGCGNDQDFEDDNNGWCGGKPKKATTPPVVDGSNEVTCPEGSTMPAGGTKVEDCKIEKVEEEDKQVEEVLGSQLGGNQGQPVTGGSVAENAVLGSQLQSLPEGVETRVLGVTIERGAAGEAATSGTGTSVLGASFARGSVLARTGFGLTLAALIGLALVLVGVGLRRAGRSEHGPLA